MQTSVHYFDRYINVNFITKLKDQLKFKSFVSRYIWKLKFPADCSSRDKWEKENTKLNLPDRFFVFARVEPQLPWASFVCVWFMPASWKCNLKLRWQHKLQLVQAEKNQPSKQVLKQNSISTGQIWAKCFITDFNLFNFFPVTLYNSKYFFPYRKEDLNKPLFPLLNNTWFFGLADTFY